MRKAEAILKPEMQTTLSEETALIKVTRLKSNQNGKADVWVVTALALWFLGVITAMAYLWNYKNTPGVEANAPTQWPSKSQIKRNPNLPTLVLFAHPLCVCTRASLTELRQLMSQFNGKLAAYVLFMVPDGVDEKEWTSSDSWQSAASIPGVQVIRDKAEYESSLFSVLTSGQVVLYNRKGRLAFNGGITAARGHVGDNPGRMQIVSLLNGRSYDQKGSPVFGCPLKDPR